MPTGWRPADVAVNYPLEYERDPHKQVKYAPETSAGLKVWSWVQYIVSTLLMTHMLIHISKIGFPMLFVYGAFLFLLIYSYSSLMDLEREAPWFSVITSIFGLSIIYFTGGWFYLETVIPGADILVSIFCVLSAGFSIYFTRAHENYTTIPGVQA
jgi:hypothetical protein